MFYNPTEIKNRALQAKLETKTPLHQACFLFGVVVRFLFKWN